MLKHAFDAARRYGITTQSNAILGIPGTTLEADFTTIRITEWCRPDLAAFGLFSPHPGTELPSIAERLGLINDDGRDYNNTCRATSINSCTEEERATQLRSANLGLTICPPPTWTIKLLPIFSHLKLTAVYRHINSLVVPYRFANIIFKRARASGFKATAQQVSFRLACYRKWK